MPALYDLMSGLQQGNRAGDSALQGMRPSGPQPQGAPQLAVRGMGELQAIIAKLNSTTEMFRSSGLPEANKHVLDLIGCAQKMQGVLVAVQKEVQDQQSQQANQQLTTGQMQ